MNYEFWRDWKRKTKLEEKAIQSLKIARKIILDHIPMEKIVAIYAGGSFVRREMNERSDVDVWVIVRDTRLLKRIEALHKKYREDFKPNLGISGYSLKELQLGESIGGKPRPNPIKFLKKLDHYPLIYGEPLDKSEFPSRDDRNELKRSLGFLERTLIPQFERTNKDFAGVVKQTFWLVDLEQRARGENPPYSWRKLAQSISEKDHIVHESLRYRRHITNDRKLRYAYVRKLKEYIKHLGDEFQDKEERR